MSLRARMVPSLKTMFVLVATLLFASRAPLQPRNAPPVLAANSLKTTLACPIAKTETINLMDSAKAAIRIVLPAMDLQLIVSHAKILVSYR